MKISNNTVYIVNPGNDDGMSSLISDTAFPALSPLALGSWIKTRIPEMNVIARDGSINGQAKILEEIAQLKPSIVGISVMGMTYLNCLNIAKCAKYHGAIVIMGNDHASQLSHEILTRRPYVDFILGSEYGELPFELLIRSIINNDTTFQAIPDLTYRNNRGQVVGYKYSRMNNSQVNLDKSKLYLEAFGDLVRNRSLDIFPILDRTLYDDHMWSMYLKNYLNSYASLHKGDDVTGVTTMNRARGCSRYKNPCSFCNIFSLDPQFSSASMFWREVMQAHQQTKATVFYEVCDSFSSFPNFIEDILKHKPKDLGFDPKFFVYTQAVDLVRKPELIPILKEIGIFKVNIGLESGSNPTLKHMKGKHDSVDTNYTALKMLQQNDIRVYGSFVLGSSAETPQTLRETIDWGKKIIDEDLIYDIEGQPILPYIGNMEGDQLSSKGLFVIDADNPDWPPDTNRLSINYVEHFSGVSYAVVRDSIDELMDYAARHGKTTGSALIRN